MLSQADLSSILTNKSRQPIQFQSTAIDHSRTLPAAAAAKGATNLAAGASVKADEGQVQVARLQPRQLSKRFAAGALPGQPRDSAPKLIQWAKEAVQYYEGSTLVLSCSLANNGGQLGLKFAWFKQGKQLASSQLNQRLNIETLSDYSFLRLNDLRSADSGLYTCLVSNQFGQEDRTSTQVLVNGEYCAGSAQVA